MELLSILTSLAAALTWGSSDFAGGLASRRAAAIRVILASQVVSGLVFVAVVVLGNQTRPHGTELLLGAAAGVGGGLGLFLLYYSLAAGKMGIAAPLTAVASAGIPLIYGFVTEGRPPWLTLAGFALALPAIWLIAHPGDIGGLRAVDILLPLLAGLGFGVYLTLLGRIPEETAIGWPLLVARTTGVVVLLLVFLLRPAASKRSLSFPWLLTLLAGLGDTAGSILYALAAQLARLDVAAVLSSLYPAVTVLMARLILKERLSPRQNIGVALGMAAVVMIVL